MSSPVKDSIGMHSRKNKKKNMTLTRPVATNGAESWALNGDINEQLATLERKVLRKMLGVIKVNENWRQRYNKELM